MPDREKVISAYECVITRGKSVCECGKCDYHIKDSAVFFCDNQRVLTDALAMLKEQEAVKPIKKKHGITINGHSCSEMYDMCGKCGNWITDEQIYCEMCGAKIDRTEGR